MVKSLGLLAIIGLVLLSLAFLPLNADTASPPPEPLINATSKQIPGNLPVYTILVFGDNRPSWTHYVTYPDVFYQMVDEAKIINPVAVIGSGDHVGEGREKQYRELYRVMVNLSNVWLVPGNHDLKWRNSDQYWKTYIGPMSYLKELPNWSIIFIDTMIPNLTDFNNTAHLLFRTAKYPNKILVIHHPLYPYVDHNIEDTDYGELKRQILENLVQEYNVKLVIQGHWHGYADYFFNGTMFIISGGAGAPLYKTSEENIKYADHVMERVYHYALLNLYPNGTFSLETVRLKNQVLKEIRVNSTTVIVYHNKTDVFKNNISIPIRQEISLGNQTLIVELLVEHGQPTMIQIDEEHKIIKLTEGSKLAYVFEIKDDVSKDVTSKWNTQWISREESSQLYMMLTQAGKSQTNTTPASENNSQITTSIGTSITTTTSQTPLKTTSTVANSANNILPESTTTSTNETANVEVTTLGGLMGSRGYLAMTFAIVILVAIIAVVLLKR